MQLRRANAVFIGAHYQDTFLYDPHGIEYTGYAHILKGWLGSKHKIAKAYYQDFIHTLEGKVVLAFLDDNKDDLRYRFPRNIKQFRKLLSGGQNRPLTFVVDRAIYDLKDLQSYWDEHLYVITWEKGCGTIKWDPKGNNVETFSFMRYRNHGGDTITYRVEHYSEQWKRDTRFKRHLARLYRGISLTDLFLVLFAPMIPALLLRLLSLFFDDGSRKTTFSISSTNLELIKLPRMLKSIMPTSPRPLKIGNSLILLPEK